MLDMCDLVMHVTMCLHGMLMLHIVCSVFLWANHAPVLQIDDQCCDDQIEHWMFQILSDSCVITHVMY